MHSSPDARLGSSSLINRREAHPCLVPVGRTTLRASTTPLAQQAERLRALRMGGEAVRPVPFRARDTRGPHPLIDSQVAHPGGLPSHPRRVGMGGLRTPLRQWRQRQDWRPPGSAVRQQLFPPGHKASPNRWPERRRTPTRTRCSDNAARMSKAQRSLKPGVCSPRGRKGTCTCMYHWGSACTTCHGCPRHRCLRSLLAGTHTRQVRVLHAFGRRARPTCMQTVHAPRHANRRHTMREGLPTGVKCSSVHIARPPPGSTPPRSCIARNAARAGVAMLAGTMQDASRTAARCHTRAKNHQARIRGSCGLPQWAIIPTTIIGIGASAVVPFAVIRIGATTTGVRIRGAGSGGCLDPTACSRPRATVRPHVGARAHRTCKSATASTPGHLPRPGFTSTPHCGAPPRLSRGASPPAAANANSTGAARGNRVDMAATATCTITSTSGTATTNALRVKCQGLQGSGELCHSGILRHNGQWRGATTRRRRCGVAVSGAVPRVITLAAVVALVRCSRRRIGQGAGRSSAAPPPETRWAPLHLLIRPMPVPPPPQEHARTTASWRRSSSPSPFVRARTQSQRVTRVASGSDSCIGARRRTITYRSRRCCARTRGRRLGGVSTRIATARSSHGPKVHVATVCAHRGVRMSRSCGAVSANARGTGIACAITSDRGGAARGPPAVTAKSNTNLSTSSCRVRRVDAVSSTTRATSAARVSHARSASTSRRVGSTSISRARLQPAIGTSTTARLICAVTTAGMPTGPDGGTQVLAAGRCICLQETIQQPWDPARSQDTLCPCQRGPESAMRARRHIAHAAQSALANGRRQPGARGEGSHLRAAHLLHAELRREARGPTAPRLDAIAGQPHSFHQPIQPALLLVHQDDKHAPISHMRHVHGSPNVRKVLRRRPHHRVAEAVRLCAPVAVEHHDKRGCPA